MRYWQWILLLVLVSTGYVDWCYALFHGRVNPILYSNTGIDISHHQGNIDWDALKGESNGAVDFVYMKATEGDDYLDPKFTENWRESQRVGIPRGAYLFVSFCSNPIDQVNFFARHVPKDTEELPPVLDVEFRVCKAQCCQELPPNDEIVDRLTKMYDALETHYGVEPIVYTTPEFYEKHLRDFPHDQFWVASWGCGHSGNPVG